MRTSPTLLAMTISGIFLHGAASAAVIVTGDVEGVFSDTVGMRIGGNFSTPGTGRLDIDGGSVHVKTGANPNTNISPLAGSSGAVSVTGPGSALRIEGVNATTGAGAFLTIGRGARGTLDVTDGAKVVIDALGATDLGSPGAAGVQVGRNIGSGGSELNISGPGSEVLVTGADHTYFRIGRDEASIVNVSNHGELTTGGENSLMSLRNGTLNVDTGGRLKTQIFNVAPVDGNDMTVNLDGAGTLVHVTDGGTLDNEYDLEDFGGFMTIGGGSASANGVVNMSNGAEIRIDSGTGIAADGSIIEGSGFSLGGNSAIGFGGEGTLNVDSSSLVTVSGGGEFVGIGRTDGGGGTVNVKNGGRVLVENNADSFGVFLATNPDSGTAVLNVGDDDPGAAPGADGQTLFDAGKILYVGVDGALANTASASVNLYNGATVSAQEIAVGSGGSITGNGTLVGDVFHNDGVIAAGNSPGTITIDGDYNLLGGVLEIEVGGTASGLFDMLEITGAANFLGGTVLFSFIDGFLPQTSDPVLDFVVAGGGTFIDPSVEFEFAGVASSFEFDIVAGPDGALRFHALNNALPAPAPAPATLWMMAAAVGLLAGRRRRQGRSNSV